MCQINKIVQYKEYYEKSHLMPAYAAYAAVQFWEKCEIEGTQNPLKFNVMGSWPGPCKRCVNS